ncbi:MAG: hypothetical protein FJ301_07355 [Planctomycetes bacterium]|nr:hypothetical protein [Planctomycetota bacterium]
MSHAVLVAYALGLALATALAGCGAKAPTEQRLLVVDGIEITFADIEPYIAFYDGYLPEGGRKSKVLRALEDQVLPLRLAQRAFPAERARLRAQAEALCSVATNALELEQQSQQVRDKRRANLTRSTALLPVGMWAFDLTRVGAVSPPLELPHGWFVVGLFDFRESPGLVMDDYVDALQVGFVTHARIEFDAWYREQQALLADKATFVHPDFEHALPSWLRPPKRS